MKSGRTRAIVVGASMAGMLTARVLADVFEQVTVLERDILPSGPDLRYGVPQASHLHALLPRGRRILEQYFPGITLELVTAEPKSWTLPMMLPGSRRKAGECDSRRNSKE
jgi:2-polyprenyl-6-methoxyphenol hydroxylase-like FAD-dependent oxidoreductase